MRGKSFLLIVVLSHSILVCCIDFVSCIDVNYPNVTLEKLAFGSCSKHDQPQLWKVIGQEKPQVWLWIGDAVYARARDSEVESAFQQQLTRRDYAEFRELPSLVAIDGVLDDHDYGINDCGASELSSVQRNASQAAFFDFIGVKSDSVRRERVGVYSSHLFGSYPKQVSIGLLVDILRSIILTTLTLEKAKVVLLDTRVYRDSYYLGNFGSLNIPFASLIGALVRWSGSVFGLGCEYEGDMLGEPQWRWLESELEETEASINVLVSSVQIFTSNPAVESWGHFPRSQKRLLGLLQRTQPKRVIFLSGDVHYGEIVAVTPARTAATLTKHHMCSQEPDEDLEQCAFQFSGVEVTSSGLTHSCKSAWWGFLCELILLAYHSHRPVPSTYYTGKNYGTLKIDWRSNSSAEAEVRVNVHDENGIIRLSAAVLSAEQQWIFPQYSFLCASPEIGQLPISMMLVALLSVSIVTFLCIKLRARGRRSVLRKGMYTSVDITGYSV